MQCASGTSGSVGRVCGRTCSNDVQEVVRALVGSFRHGSCGMDWVGDNGATAISAREC